MRKLWVIRCPHCNQGLTVAMAPGLQGFIEQINCSACNKQIDASTGFYVMHPVKYYKEPYDLLSVS